MSSFFDEASLVMIPSGYKNQKVYSVKPLDGSGDLTFSRASSATRVASNGLIEKVRTNVALYSEQFNEATWNKFNNATATANTTTAPNGTTTADTYGISTAATTFPNISQDLAATNGITYTFSVYAKKNVTNFVKLRVGGTAFSASTNSPMFNLNTGVVTSGTGTIESVGNGWYRCSFKETAGATATGGFAIDLPDANGVWSGSSVYTASDSVFIWGFQTEVSDFGATDYIATTTAAVSVGPVSGLPRLDYLNSTCPRLLLEPQRTNVALYSEQINNAAWISSNVTITANNTNSPDGYINADKVASNTSNASHSIGPALTTFLSSTTYTSSVFVKKDTGRYFQLVYGSGAFGVTQYANFDLQLGTVTFQGANASAKIDNFGNGWYRCSITSTATADFSDSCYSVIITSGTAARAESHSTALSYWVYGYQIEAGAYATSYIPTLGTSVTRVADAASKTGISSLIGQTEGVLFVEATLTHSAANNEYLIQVSVDDDNRFFIYREGSTNKLGCFARVGASTIFTNLTAAASTGTIKAAFAYKSGSFAFYVNGVQVAVSSATYTTPASMGIFNLDSNAGSENGFYTYAQTLLFKTRLTNAQLAELTTL